MRLVGSGLNSKHNINISVQWTLFVFVGVMVEKEAGMQSTASAQDDCHSGPMHNPGCVKCLYAWVVHGYCCSNSVFCVCESSVLYIFYSAQPRLQVSLNARRLCPMPDRHRATQAHPPSQQGHSKLVIWWPNVVCMA